MLITTYNDLLEAWLKIVSTCFFITGDVRIDEHIGEIDLITQISLRLPIFSWLIRKWYKRKLSKFFENSFPVGVSFKIVVL